MTVVVLGLASGSPVLADDRGDVIDDEGAAAPLLAQAAQTVAFDIPPQALAPALTAFGRQAGYQLSVDHGDLANLSTPGVNGTMTPADALRRLLAGTNVIWRFADERTVVLERTASEGALTLGPITVQARNESAYGPVDGYKASRSATATKTDTPIIEVPAAVQVISRQVIDDQGALNLKDVYENASSVQQAGNTLNAQSEVLPIIRGFESPTLLRNGLRSSVAGAVDLVNVERVEVLKGPASILYGALEPGGLVNYVTKRPQAEPRHQLEQLAGSYGLLRTTGDFTGPITQDGSLLYRLNAAYTNSESFRDRVELERVAVAPSISWLPTDRTEVLVDLAYLREEQPYDTGIPLSADGKPLTSEEAFFGDPDLDGRTNEDFLASYQVTHQFNPVWRVRNQAQFHRADNRNEALRPRGVGGAPGSELLGLRYQNEDRRDDEVQFVLDATASFATSAADHTLLLGVELISQDSEFRRFRQNAPSVVITDDPDIDFTPPTQQPQQVILGETRRAGLYVQDQISLLQHGRLKLLLGGRYDSVHQENKTDGIAAPDVDDGAFSGRAGLLYQFADNYAAYASVSQSFQPQSSGTLDAGGMPLDPEEGLQYEIGVKGSLFGDGLLVTASVYQIEKTNVAVFDQDLFDATGQIAYFPGVEQRSRGFEVDVTGALTDQIRLLANYSYTATEVLENAGDPTMIGEPLGGVPRHKARVWLTYQFDEAGPFYGLGFGGGVRYVGTSTAQFETDLELDPYIVADAGAWYSWDSVRIGLNVHNLFDEAYIVRANTRAISHPGAPRTVIGSVSMRF